MTAELTADARRALDQAGLSRRRFLQGTGAIVVAFASSSGIGRWPSCWRKASTARSSQRLDSWIAIGADGVVTAYTGKCEFGQGLYTAQLQLVAEELCVPIERVNLLQCDTSLTPDQGTTSGQQSHPANFNQANLALAAATAREALVKLAADAAGCRRRPTWSSADGAVARTADASRQVSYAELIGGRRFDLALDQQAQRSHPQHLERAGHRRCRASTFRVW